MLSSWAAKVALSDCKRKPSYMLPMSTIMLRRLRVASILGRLLLDASPTFWNHPPARSKSGLLGNTIHRVPVRMSVLPGARVPLLPVKVGGLAS